MTVDTLWGYPISLVVRMNDENVDVSAALVMDFGPPFALHVDADKILDVLAAHEATWCDHAWEPVSAMRCAKCKLVPGL